MNKKLILIFLVITILVFSVGIVFLTRERKEPSEIYVSFYPLEFFVNQLMGEEVATSIVPVGAEAHDYEPTPEDIAQISKSKLLVYNGNGFEPWVEDFTNTPEGEKITKFNASDFVESIEKDEQHTDELKEEEHEEEENHGNLDPHFWLDPIAVIEISNNLAKNLKSIYPEKSSEIEANRANFIKELENLDTDYAEGLGQCTLNKIVTSHEAYSYLGQRYGIEIVSIAGISPQEEPTAQKMADISNIVKAEGIKYIFFESALSEKLSQTIADETGAEILYLNPVENLTEEEELRKEDYLSITRSNLVNLKTAMECL